MGKLGIRLMPIDRSPSLFAMQLLTTFSLHTNTLSLLWSRSFVLERSEFFSARARRTFDVSMFIYCRAKRATSARLSTLGQPDFTSGFVNDSGYLPNIDSVAAVTFAVASLLGLGQLYPLKSPFRMRM